MTASDNRLVCWAGVACAVFILAGSSVLLRNGRAPGTAPPDLVAAGLLPVDRVPTGWRVTGSPLTSQPVELRPLAPPVDESRPRPDEDATREIPSAAPAAPSSAERQAHAAPAQALGDRLGWRDGGQEVEHLAAWLVRLRADERATLADPVRFNRAADAHRQELLALFGRAAAEAIAAQLPLHRLDAGTGALQRVDLEGRPLADEPLAEPR